MKDNAPMAMRFQEALDTVLDRFRDEGITLGEAIGTLEVVKLNLWRESAFREDGESKPDWSPAP